MGPVTEEGAEKVVSVRGAAYETRLRLCPLDKSIPTSQAIVETARRAKMGAKLYVGNLSYSVTEERLQQHFAQHGSVVSARIITDKFSGRSKGFGFVEMGSDEEAERAISALNGTDFEGRNIVVSEARPQAPREGGGGRPPRRDRY